MTLLIGLFPQSILLLVPHHPRLHGQLPDQHHEVWRRLLRNHRDELHQENRPMDAGDPAEGTRTPPIASVPSAREDVLSETQWPARSSLEVPQRATPSWAAPGRTWN